MRYDTMFCGREAEELLKMLINDSLIKEQVIEEIILSGASLNLDGFLEDDNANIRLALAKIGYKSDILVKDSDIEIRAELAKNGYELNTLAYDDSPRVREMAIDSLVDFFKDYGYMVGK